MTSPLLLPLILAGALAAPAPGRTPSPPTSDTAGLAAADSIVSEWVASGRIPGAVLHVSRGGKVVLQRAYGAAQAFAYGEGRYGAWRAPDAAAAPVRLEPAVAMTTETRFDLASVTKVMATTFAVMLLVDEGELDLDAPVRTWLPDFSGGGKDAITPRHLLTHRSGMVQWHPVYYHAADADAAYAFVRDLPLAWGVGEGRHYSDLGFMVLGRLVERVSGVPLDTFLRERLYGPLGLTRTGFRRGTDSAPSDGPFAATSHGNPYEYRMVHDSTFGYRIDLDAGSWDGWRRHTLIGEVNDGNAWYAFAGVAGHAGLFSTAGELDVLLRLLLNRGELAGRRLLDAEVVDEFLRDTGESQALGWQAPAWAPPGTFAHTGFTGTWVLGAPRDGTALVLLTNRQNVGVDTRTLYPDVGPLQRAVGEAVLGATTPSSPGPSTFSTWAGSALVNEKPPAARPGT